MKSRITQEMRLVVELFRSGRVRRMARRLFRIDPELTFLSIKKAKDDEAKLISSFKHAAATMNPDQ